MTDNEIIKALECCTDIDLDSCEKCPIRIECYNNTIDIKKAALDLINRQKAEIERLNKEVDRLSQCVLYHDGQIVDAVKDFAERLIHKIVNTPTKFESTYYMYRQGIEYRQNEIIDIIVEMAGDNE